MRIGLGRRHFVLVADEHADFFALAHAQVGGGIEAGTLLHKGVHHMQAQRLGQLAQLGQRGIELDIADARQLYRRNDGAHGFVFHFTLHSGMSFFQLAEDG